MARPTITNVDHRSIELADHTHLQPTRFRIECVILHVTGQTGGLLRVAASSKSGSRGFFSPGPHTTHRAGLAVGGSPRSCSWLVTHGPPTSPHPVGFNGNAEVCTAPPCGCDVRSFSPCGPTMTSADSCSVTQRVATPRAVPTMTVRLLVRSLRTGQPPFRAPGSFRVRHDPAVHHLPSPAPPSGQVSPGKNAMCQSASAAFTVHPVPLGFAVRGQLASVCSAFYAVSVRRLAPLHSGFLRTRPRERALAFGSWLSCSQ